MGLRSPLRGVGLVHQDGADLSRSCPRRPVRVNLAHQCPSWLVSATAGTWRRFPVAQGWLRACHVKLSRALDGGFSFRCFR